MSLPSHGSTTFAEMDEPPEWLSYAVERALPGDGVTAWVPTGRLASSALTRVARFPAEIDADGDPDTSLQLACNGSHSAQVALACTEPLENLRAGATEFVGPDGERLPPEAVRARFVGYVPVEGSRGSFEFAASVEEIGTDGVSGTRRPDVVGDPLLECETVDVPALRAQSVWYTFEVPGSASPGEYEGTLRLSADGYDSVTFDVTLEVREATVPDPGDGRFHLDVWFHADAVAAEHDLEPWSDAHWRTIERYLADLAARGQRVVAVPIVHQPWQIPWLSGRRRPQTAAGYESMVEWRYDGAWRFDFSRFDRYVETAFELGVGPTISAYSVLTFRPPQRLSYRNPDGEFVVEEVEAGSDRWREAWAAFLTDFVTHLESRGWLERTYLGFDERPAEQMREAVDLIEEVAPEFSDRIQIAGSVDVEEFADDLSVLHRHLPLDDDLLERRRESGRTTTYYVCVVPTHPNTFTVSPAVESRMIPWIAARENLDGFLRWAYNSWPEDPYRNPVFQFPQGDEYLVYPGEDGPVSSVRWELLRDGIQEFELAARLRERGGAGDSLGEALDLAARDPDARTKDARDLVRARRLLLDALVPE